MPRRPARPPVIATAGTIGSGKTTFASIFSATHTLVYEDFRAVPFWEAFYADPGAHAFETELSFLLQHYHQLKRAAAGSLAPVLTDWSFVMDLAYARMGLTASELSAFRAVHRQVARVTRPPDLLVRLRCPAPVALERLRRRGRPEEATLTVDFLARLDAHIDEVVHDQRSPVLDLDSDRLDFANDPEVREAVRSTLAARLFSPR